MTNTPYDINASAQFAKVVDIFKAAFEAGEELGASFSIYKDGQPLLSLIGGWADRQKTQALTHNHLFAFYSSGKVAASLVIAWLVDQDRIGYDQLVSTIWPDFAQNGKADITIGDVLSHQAGLSGITNPDWTAEDWYDTEKIAAELAAQAPLFERGQSGYHPTTFGPLLGEIARRADAQMRSLGTILREEICEPFDLDIWIGLPESEHDRCVAMQKPRALPELGEKNEATRAAFLTRYGSPGGPQSRWRAAEFAGSNCHANADSLARMMQIINNGRIGDIPVFAEDMADKIAAPRVSGLNLVLPFDLTIGAGLMHNAPNFFYGPNPNTLGHSGWGGSCVFADPDKGITGAYVMNRQSHILIGDPRPVALINAVYAGL